MNSPLEELSRLRTGRTRRVSSYDRTGGNRDSVRIEAGQSVTIARIEGPGAIKHIWFTIAHEDPMFGRNMVLRMYWDGVDRPSVECPIGDFFGQGWGEHYNYAALPLAASPAGGRGLNCYFPMPFADGAVVTVENDSEEPCRAFYYYIDYQEMDSAPAEHGRFHANWNRSRRQPPGGGVETRWMDYQHAMKNLTDKFNHPIIDAEGRGHYVGVNYFVESPSLIWYGEGDDMFFIDGEAWPPSLHGTGTEDYFNCSWCPKEYFIHPYFGYARVTPETGHLGRTHCYRFHIEDPVIFEKSLRGSIERGHANNMTLDIATAAYWYQTLPHKPFAPLPDRAGRQPMPRIDVKSFQMWRETWRQAMGGGDLWGSEALPPAASARFLKKMQGAASRLAPAKNRKIAKEELRKQQAMLEPRKARAKPKR